jgi:hypothetical protein
VALNAADKVVQDKSTTLQEKQDAVALAREAVDQAQANYDNSLINDPTWVAPTYQKERIRTVENTRTVEVRTLVPTTTTTLQEQVIPNLLFNSDFSRSTEGWSGVNPGWQGSNPALIDGEIIFSYQNQTVSQGLFSGPFQNATLTLSADWLNNDTNRGITDNYSMKVEAKDINQNLVGTATYTSTGSHEWENKSVSLVATGPVSYITVSFSGIDNGFWYGIYGPHFKNPTLQISHGQMVTETTYEEVITYEQETYYTYETYYTTELLLTEGTVQVKINEGGEATFVAPAGATFISSNLRYEAIDRPTCGTGISPQLNGLSTITIQALNSVWGDPCGGWQKHITGTLTYLGQPAAPLIKDPSLLALIDEPTTIYNNAVNDYSVAQTDLSVSQASLRNLQDEQSKNVVTIDVAQQGVTTKQEELSVAEQELAAIPPFKDPTPTPTQTQEPIKEPEKPITPEIPEPITPTPTQPELPVNIETVNPQELTASQVTELISVANEILNNSEQGSEEYEQALEALFVAAEANDITVSEDLAAIPLLGNAAVALTDAINFIGNVGADMSPKVREESEKIVVTAVVAVGAAVNAATGAALGAAAPSAGGSSAGGSASNNTNTRRNK